MLKVEKGILSGGGVASTRYWPDQFIVMRLTAEMDMLKKMAARTPIIISEKTPPVKVLN
jgi:hypothetical protein